MAIGHTRDDEPLPSFAAPVMLASSTLRYSVEDLLKFDQALRSGKLVSAESLKLLTTPKPELNSPDYGYGFFASANSPSTGHSGGFIGINSDLRMYLGSGWTIAVMSNYSRGAGPVTDKMAALVAAVGN